jgi:two-component system, OmpR family, response regulator MtrA
MRARILLLEDDARIRAAMRLALEHEGHKVQEAASGEEALGIFAAERPTWP